jgi:hypothetical protein
MALAIRIGESTSQVDLNAEAHVKKTLRSSWNSAARLCAVCIVMRWLKITLAYSRATSSPERRPKNQPDPGSYQVPFRKLGRLGVR